MRTCQWVKVGNKRAAGQGTLKLWIDSCDLRWNVVFCCLHCLITHFPCVIAVQSLLRRESSGVTTLRWKQCTTEFDCFWASFWTCAAFTYGNAISKSTLWKHKNLIWQSKCSATCFVWNQHYYQLHWSTNFIENLQPVHCPHPSHHIIPEPQTRKVGWPRSAKCWATNTLGMIIHHKATSFLFALLPWFIQGISRHNVLMVGL